MIRNKQTFPFVLRCRTRPDILSETLVELYISQCKGSNKRIPKNELHHVGACPGSLQLELEHLPCLGEVISTINRDRERRNSSVNSVIKRN